MASSIRQFKWNRFILEAVLDRILRYALFCLFLAQAISSASASAVRLAGIDYLVEDGRPLELQQAVSLHLSGKFRPETRSIPDFGINSNPVWLHLSIDNPSGSAANEYLVAGMTWLDHFDVYVLHSGKLLNRVRTGDETENAPGLTPALGYAIPIAFPPGESEIYLRLQCEDPMVLPIRLLSNEEIEKGRIRYGYFYGFFYGYLAALCIYNLLLFAGLRERSHLYYSLALLSAIFCNVSYTGHGAAWVWPGFPSFQRYVILATMVAYSVTGLLFASRFLSLSEHAPRIRKMVGWFSVSVISAMAFFILEGNQAGAALLAFSTIAVFTVFMVLLGILTARKGMAAGRYFLAATCFGLVGAAVTDFAVWGKIRFTALTFHAFEIGLVIEATLLALALAYRMRQYQEANLQAEKMARQDPLTGLSNRRAFMELASLFRSSAGRGGRSLMLIMMDIDHFKGINDRYGHRAGDEVLIAVGSMLKRQSRTSDIVARWGGEEFILLLTETDLEHARSYAEKLRKAVAELRVNAGSQIISLTASFGLAKCSTDLTLEDMIHLADAELYRAKSEGRNRVCSNG